MDKTNPIASPSTGDEDRGKYTTTEINIFFLSTEITVCSVLMRINIRKNLALFAFRYLKRLIQQPGEGQTNDIC